MKKIISLLLCLANPSYGAIAYVGAADLGNNNNSSTTLTASYTVGSGSDRMLVVGVKGSESTYYDISGVTYNGTAMTLLDKQGPGNRWIYFFYLLNPDSGTHNVVITATLSGYILAVAADYTGVSQTGQPDATTKGTGLSGAYTGTVTTTANNSWGILMFGGYSGTSPLAGSGSTRRAYDGVFGTIGLFDSNGPKTPAGSFSMTANYAETSASTNGILGTFSPATGSPPATTNAPFFGVDF